MPAFSREWSRDRVAQVEQLLDLLIVVEGLDSGSGFTAKARSAIEIARGLNRTNYDEQQISFADFLRAQANLWILSKEGNE